MLRKGDEPVLGYRLVRFLGKGQYGEVWQANGPGGTRVALKFINVSGAQGQKELRGVQRVKEIRHPHLMPITALWLLDEEGNSLDDTYFQTVVSDEREALKGTLAIDAKHPTLLVVAMGYCDENLSDRLAEVNAGIPQSEWHGIPVEELLIYMSEAAKAIDFLNSPRHDLGDGLVSIQHCDIKPANIMLVGGAVQVCDFGLARMMSDNLKATATGMVGSPAFMAPECIRKRPSTASDQYSLAITYYELRSGRLPFHDLSYMAVLDSHQAGVLDFSAVGEDEQAVLRRATALEPEDRYATCLEMVGALEEALAGELPNLRSSPAAGKLRAQSPSARSIASDTARATGTTRENARRSRRVTRLGTKLGLGLALLALAGLAVVFTVPGIRETIRTLIAADEGQQGEQETAEAATATQTSNASTAPIDFDAALAEAEQNLQEDDLDKSAQQFQDLEKSLSNSGVAASTRLLDSARLGSLRVQARRSDVDWNTTLAALQQLGQSSSLDAQASARLDVLELLGKATLGQATLEERIKELVRLLPQKQLLDRWETAELARLQTDALGEVAEAQQERSLEPALLDDIVKLGGDKVGLLLARAERQYNQRAFADSRATLAQIGGDARDEDRIRRDKILLMNDLTDDAFDAQTAVSRFASIAAKLPDPTQVVALLLERARTTPAIIDTTAEQLALVGRAAGGETRAQLNRAYASLLALRIRARLSLSDVSVADLLRDCEQVRIIDKADPLVNTCWVECRILSPTKDVDRLTWAELDTNVQQAIRSKDVEPSHVAYFHFVAGLLLHHHPTPKSSDGADEILKTRDMDSELLQLPRRRRLIEEILVAAAAEIGLPTDADLAHEFTAGNDVQTAYRYLEFGSRSEVPHSDAWKASYIIAAALVADAQAADNWLQLSDEMLANKDSTAFLESQQLIGQVLLLSARGFAQRFQKLQQSADRDKAIQRYAALIARLHNPRRVNVEFADLALYTQVVRPAYELASRSIPNLDEVSPDLKPSLARIYGAVGRLLERDAAVSRLVSGDAAKSERVAEAYATAARLDMRAEYLVGTGRAIVNSPDYIERLQELGELADRVQKLDNQLPEGYALKSNALVIESRQKTNYSESRELLLDAIKACNRAIELSQPGDDDYASNYEVLSAAHLETAFFTDTLEGKRTHLVQAEDAARLALEVKERLRPENAFNCLGNALEDRAYYLGEIANYKPALEAFIDGAGVAADAGRDASNSLYAAGRCRLRQVLADGLREGEKDSALMQAELELKQAIGAWRLFSQKKAIQHRIAEAEFWRSEVIRSRAMRRPTTAEALPLLADAESAREASVQLAKTLKSLYWAEYQIEWAKLAWDRAASSSSLDEAKKFLTISAERAEAVLAEDKLEASALQISPNAKRGALSQLIQVDLTRSDLLLRSLKDSQWTPAFENEAEAYAQAAVRTAGRIQDEFTSRSARISALTMLGSIKIKSARNSNFSAQQAATATDSAEKSFREAVKLGGDDIGLCAQARVGLASLLMRRMTWTNDASVRTKLRDESLQTLSPIQPEHVDPQYFQQVSRLRIQLNAEK
jgi:serine/threonine protein kinase